MLPVWEMRNIKYIFRIIKSIENINVYKRSRPQREFPTVVFNDPLSWNWSWHQYYKTTRLWAANLKGRYCLSPKWYRHTLFFRLQRKDKKKCEKCSLLLISQAAPVKGRYQSLKFDCKCYVTPFISCLITIWRCYVYFPTLIFVPCKHQSKVCVQYLQRTCTLSLFLILRIVIMLCPLVEQVIIIWDKFCTALKRSHYNVKEICLKLFKFVNVSKIDWQYRICLKIV